MSDDIVQKFRGLEQAERLNALKKLIFTFNTEEREFAYAAISQRTDPICVLPVELVLHIFDYLNLFKTWTLQRVSKRWQKTLSAEDFLRSALQRWHTEDSSDRADDGGLHRSLKTRLQHMRAVTRGWPLSEKVYDNTGTGLQGPQPKLSPRRFDFKGKRIAYVSSHQGQGDAVIVRDLLTGEEQTLRGEARERILAVVLTTALVGFVTFDGCLYVMQFSQGTPKDRTLSIRLPSSGIQAIGGDGQTIVMVMDERVNSPNAGSVVVYNAEIRDMKAFTLCARPTDIRSNMRPLHSCSILVNEEQDTVDVFWLQLEIFQRFTGHPFPARKVLKVENFRSSIGGSALSHEQWNVPINFDTTVRDFQFLMVPPCPTGRKNEYRITICEVPFMGGLPCRYKASVLFDLHRGRFLTDQVQPAAVELYEDPDIRLMHILWKNVWHRPLISEDWFEYVFYMNDSFMVSFEVSKFLTQHSRIRVLCFDADVDLEGSKALA